MTINEIQRYIYSSLGQASLIQRKLWLSNGMPVVLGSTGSTGNPSIKPPIRKFPPFIHDTRVRKFTLYIPCLKLFKEHVT